MSIIGKFLEKRGLNPNGEMNIMEHIEEFRWHFIRSLIAILICSIIVLINIDYIFAKIILGPADTHFITYRALCALGKAIHVKGLCMTTLDMTFQSNKLSGQFNMSLSSSFMIGFIVAFPYIFWEFWRFIKPALKKKELKYARGIVFWSSLLFFIGVLFAYFIVAPFTISFFANFHLNPKFHNIFTINNYYATLSDIILAMGIVFELPVIVYFLARLGIINPRFLRKSRRYAYLIITVLSAILTPVWVSMLLTGIPLVILYEISIMLCARIVKSKAEKQQLNW